MTSVGIVTGGGRGIGAAAVVKLLEHVDHVAIFDLQATDVDAGIRDRVSFHTVDVTDREVVDRTVGELAETHGRIEVLVNNAGTTDKSNTMWETPVELFERMWRIHFLGTVHPSQAVIPHMMQAGYGRIVNVASVAGKEGNAGSSAYSAAKAAVIGLTKSMGKELATTGVIVNAVTPGIIETPIIADATPEHVAKLLAKIPMNRAGKPEEVAELIGWLASNKCSFSTGAVFDISGGRTTY